MPCDSSYTIGATVSGWTAERFAAAVRNSDISGRVYFANGQIFASVGSEEKEEAARLIARARQLYGAQVIKDASKRFGFQIRQQSTTKTGNIQLQIGR